VTEKDFAFRMNAATKKQKQKKTQKPTPQPFVHHWFSGFTLL